MGDGEAQPRPDGDVEFGFLSSIVFFSGRKFFHEKCFHFGEGFKNWSTQNQRFNRGTIDAWQGPAVELRHDFLEDCEESDSI